MWELKTLIVFFSVIFAQIFVFQWFNLNVWVWRSAIYPASYPAWTTLRHTLTLHLLSSCCWSFFLSFLEFEKYSLLICCLSIAFCHWFLWEVFVFVCFYFNLTYRCCHELLQKMVWPGWMFQVVKQDVEILDETCFSEPLKDLLWFENSIRTRKYENYFRSGIGANFILNQL